jgi:3-methyladenine DNA glycosylase/8-oxoguanine DNA glycosylase
LNQETWTLTRVIDLGKARPVTVMISEGKRAVKVNVARNVGQRAIEKIIRDVRHMLRLDDDMTLFYTAVGSDPDFSWIANSGAGRLLRAPTVFEDLVNDLQPIAPGRHGQDDVGLLTRWAVRCRGQNVSVC